MMSSGRCATAFVPLSSALLPSTYAPVLAASSGGTSHASSPPTIPANTSPLPPFESLDLGDGEPRHGGELPNMRGEHRSPLVVRDPPRAPETVCVKHDAALRVVKQKAHPALCVPVPHAHADGKGCGFFCKFRRALFLKYDMPVAGRQGEHRGVPHHGIERCGKKVGDGEHRRARARAHRRLTEKS